MLTKYKQVLQKLSIICDANTLVKFVLENEHLIKIDFKERE